MTISIWRYSHLALAVSSFIFIFIASITGIILAFEPISNQLKPYKIKNAEKLSVAQSINVLQTNYDEILSIEIDANDFIVASVITLDGNHEKFYVNLFTGKKIGEIIQKEPIFEFATNLHRSLFLKSTGRFFVGFASFLLFLITISGCILIIKRQRGTINFFKKVIKDDFFQYYHIITGRLLLIPIIIITVTGVYLSLLRFLIIPEVKINHHYQEVEIKNTTENTLKNFGVFKNIQLKDVKKLEFPFSSDPEDYYFLKLKDRELIINQFTGYVISEKNDPLVNIISALSISLHTGRGSIIWSFVLLIASINLLFFIYSGFNMTLKRRKGRFKNKFHKDFSKYIILIGSENGSTLQYANLFHEALLNAGQKSFITQLNNYTSYKKAEHLIIITSTYGVGEAPENAKEFFNLYTNNPINNPYKFSVLGFGSLSYPDFCKYAYDVNLLLLDDKKSTQFLEPYTINNKSFEAFKQWVGIWSEKTKVSISIPENFKEKKSEKTTAFIVVQKTQANEHPDDTFIVVLKPCKTIGYKPGDLLSIIPPNDNFERFYSIGVNSQNQLLLSIKRHDMGKCSNYINSLKKNDIIKGSIKKNPDFHFPKKCTCVVLIGNGTGIAPFLGMINANIKRVKTVLYWGGKTKKSYALYANYIEKNIEEKKLSKIHFAFSKENKNKTYVQHLIKRDHKFIVQVLKANGVIMICGSVAMQKDVMSELASITMHINNKPLSYYINRQQIKMDCY